MSNLIQRKAESKIKRGYIEDSGSEKSRERDLASLRSMRFFGERKARIWEIPLARSFGGEKSLFGILPGFPEKATSAPRCCSCL